MANRITEQKLKNKRFKNTEKSIIKAYLLFYETINVERLIKTAHISRSTLYRHHKNIQYIVPDYETFFLAQYTKYIKRLSKFCHFRLKDFYEQTLIFLCRYHEIAEFLMQCSNRDISDELIRVLKPIILATDKIPNGEILEVYFGEVTALIKAWQQNGFQTTEISATVDKIMFLTNTARTRLNPLDTIVQSRPSQGVKRT